MVDQKKVKQRRTGLKMLMHKKLLLISSICRLYLISHFILLLKNLTWNIHSSALGLLLFPLNLFWLMERLTIVGQQNASSKMNLCDVKLFLNFFISYPVRHSLRKPAWWKRLLGGSRTHAHIPVPIVLI